MKLNQLIENVADMAGEPLGSLKLRARLLREARLLSSGGRGAGGAEMTAEDVATLLFAVVAPGDTTNLVQLSKLMRDAEFSDCEWLCLKQIELDADPSADWKNSVYPGMCPPGMGRPTDKPTALQALARLLELGAEQSSSMQFTFLETHSDRDGLTVKIIFALEIAFGDIVAAFIEGTGDPTDAMLFPDYDPAEVSYWNFTASFEVNLPQVSRKQQILRLPGEIVSEVAKMAL